MLNALARGDSGLRESIGARAAWPAPPPSACTQPHRGRPSPRDPGAGACGATHSRRPLAQGIMASQPPTPGQWQPRGPGGWSARGAQGPSAFQAPWLLASAPRDLHDQRPSNIPLFPLRLGFPLYSEATVNFYSPRREATISGAPSPSPPQRGTGEAPRGCLGPALPLLSAPPASSSLAAPAPG